MTRRERKRRPNSLFVLLLGYETEQLAVDTGWCIKNSWFWSGKRMGRSQSSNDFTSRDKMVSVSRTLVWCSRVHICCGYLGRRLYLCRTHVTDTLCGWWLGYRSTHKDIPCSRYTYWSRLAGKNAVHLSIERKESLKPKPLLLQGMTSLPDYVQFKMFPKVPLRQYFTAAGSDAIDLLEKMLVFDPSKRWTAEEVRILCCWLLLTHADPNIVPQCLKHSYFRNSPLPTPPEKLPKKAPDPEKVAQTLKRKPDDLEEEDAKRTKMWNTWIMHI